MAINVESLKLILAEKGMSQKALSDAFRISSKTISRILAGEERNSNKKTTERIAKAIGVKPEELAASPADKKRRELNARLRAYLSTRTIVDLDGLTNIHFDLVSSRYGITTQALIKAAPLLYTILAEMSLSDRRKRLADFQNALSSAAGFSLNHLGSGIAIADYKMERLLDKEEASIDAADLAGATINGEDEAEDWWVEDDLFVGFLDRLARDTNTDLIEIEGGTSSNLEYSILRDDLSRITGASHFADEALRLGRVRLRDIPDNLLGHDKASERAEWLASHLTSEDRADLQALHEAMKSFTPDLAVTNSTEDSE